MEPLYVVVGLVLVGGIAFALMKGRAASSPEAPSPSSERATSTPAADLPSELIGKIREVEAAAPLTSPADDEQARALFEQGMVKAETSRGNREALHEALALFEKSRAAKHNSGFAEVGFAEVLRQAALAHGPAPHEAALEKSLEYAQKSTAQNSLEREAWVSYAHALVATGSPDDGLGVMDDYAEYEGYRMFRARAEAAIAHKDAARAAENLEKAMAGCSDPEARSMLATRLEWVRSSAG